MTGEPTPAEGGDTTAKKVLVGRYQIGELIGRGGMAEVHAGWDTRLGREVAIKVLRSDFARDHTFLQRFRREAQSAASLNHPGIVAVYDSGEDKTTELGGAELAVPFIVMELVHGKTLREKLHERGGPLELNEACKVMAATLRALSYSHTNGLIHRDIKPANVMVTDDDAVKLTDFGIARAIADTAATLTNTAVVVGTAQYLSPEQAQGKAIDARADVYAAGCVLYELLTGRPPFTGESPLAIAYQHVGQAPELPSVHVSSLPPEIDAVLMRTLSKDPDGRYASAGEFAADLESIAAGRGPAPETLAVLPGPAPEEETPAEETPGESGAAAPEEAAEPDTAKQGVVPAKRDGDTSDMPTVPATPSMRQRILIGVAGVVGVLVLVVLGVLASQGRIGDIAGVTVPDVRTKTLHEAQDELGRLGLATDVRSVPNKAPKDTVVRQNPEGGQQAPSGSRIRLEVSSGPGNVEVPNLSSYQVSVAETLLQDRQLAYTIERVESVDIGRDHVVGTEPKAGTVVKEGSSITLLVSSGKVTVPNLLGYKESDARNELMKLGLTLNVTVVDGGGTPGSVIKHDYAGTAVNQGSTVNATVVREIPRPVPTVTHTVTQPAPPPPSPTKPPSPTTSAPTATTKPPPAR